MKVCRMDFLTIEQNILDPDIWNLSKDSAYKNWREKKLKSAQKLKNAPFINIRNLANPSLEEIKKLAKYCSEINMALYQTSPKNNPDEVRSDLKKFTEKMGLKIAEKHRSADRDGIVAITPTDKETQRAYIPYSNKALNWHTDGYYNDKKEQIRSMVLHCLSPANKGGESQFLDPEIAYIRMRDKNPEFIRAFMHEEAMIIPENLDERGILRKKSVGPVFSFDKKSNHLIMRYTARTRFIEWRKDKITKQAVDFLQNLLLQGDEFMRTTILQAGQGILCNNSLHNRSAFEDENNKRLLFRIRFYNRIGKVN